MRAEVARLKARLGDLDEFEAEWRMYADRLRALAVEMTGRGPRDIPAELRPTLNRVEEIRVRIVALGNTKFDSAYFNRTEFTPLTRANLRTHPHDLFERITEPTWFPRSKDHVKLNPLEALLGEAQGLIARKREAIKADLRAKELRVAEHERGAVTLRARPRGTAPAVPDEGIAGPHEEGRRTPAGRPPSRRRTQVLSGRRAVSAGLVGPRGAGRQQPHPAPIGPGRTTPPRRHPRGAFAFRAV